MARLLRGGRSRFETLVGSAGLAPLDLVEAEEDFLLAGDVDLVIRVVIGATAAIVRTLVVVSLTRANLLIRV